MLGNTASITQPAPPIAGPMDIARRLQQAGMPSLLSQYMRDVGQFSLLTRAEEKRLSRKLREKRQRWRDILVSHLLHVPLLLTVRPRVCRGSISVADLVTSHRERLDETLTTVLDNLHALCREMRLSVRQARRQLAAAAFTQAAMALRSDMCVLLAPWPWQDAFLQQAWRRFDGVMTQPSNVTGWHPAVRFMANLGYSFQELVVLWRQLSDLLTDIEKSKSEMIASNLRLVIKVAKDYSHTTLPLEDLIQEGNIGLMRAVDKYDYRLNLKFSTYAVWWIKQAMQRAILSQTSDIRIPEYLYQTVSQVAKTRLLLTKEQGNEPTLQDIAHHLNIPLERAERSIMLEERRVLSLEWDGLDGESRPLRMSLADTATKSVQETVEQNMLHRQIHRAIEYLSPCEAHIIRRYFGFDGQSAAPLREIGLDLGLSHERVRQLLMRALATLKQQGAELWDFVATEQSST